MIGRMSLGVDARLEVGRADAAVLDAMTPPRPRRLALGAGHGVQRLLDRAIADGVDGALEFLTMRPPDQVVEVLLLPVENAVVLAVRRVGLAGGGGGPAGGAIGHHLEGAQPQPLVAEARVQAGAEQAHQGMLTTVDRRERVDPQAQPAGAGEVLAGHEGGPDEPAGVVDARAPSRDVRAVGAEQRLAELRGRGHRCHLQRCLCRLVGDAELAAAVPVVAAAGRVGGGVGDAGQRQRAAVDRGDVATRPREDHRMLGRHHVPVVPVRMTLLDEA
jgi:hypothetical protein